MCSRITLVLLAAALTMASPMLAQADVDLTGSWDVFSDTSSGSQTWNIVQSGSSLSVTFNAQLSPGTITPQTGAFSVVIAPLTFCPGVVSATASADGNAFDGALIQTVLYCPGGIQSCTCVSGPIIGAVRACRVGAPGACCGDHVVDAGEACDNGPEPATGCCDATCHARTVGTSCTDDASICTTDTCNAGGTCTHPAVAVGTSCYDDLNPCTTDACDAAGTCAHPPGAAGLPCLDDTIACTADVCDATGACTHPLLLDTDSDGLCDALDECSLGITLEPTRLKISGFGTSADDDRLAIRSAAMLPLPITPPIDPASHGLRLLLRDGSGGSLLDVTVPPGAWSSSTGTGWTVKPGNRFQFRSPTPLGGAIRTVRVQVPPTPLGRVRVTITGAGGSFLAGGFALPPRLTVLFDPPATPSAQCAEATFTAAACSYQSGATTLSCH